MRVLLLFTTLLAASPQAFAEEASRPQTTDGHAYTLNSHEFRLGLWTFEYGILDVAEIGTAPILLALKVKNAFTKIRLHEKGPLALAVSAGYLNLNTADFQVRTKDEDGNVQSEPNLDLFSLYGALNGSWRDGHSVYSAALIYAQSGVIGSAGDAADFEGALIGTTGSLELRYEHALTPSFALELGAHVALLQVADVDVSARQPLGTEDPPRATLEIFGAAQADLAENRNANASASILWNYGSFNLKLGLMYGYVKIPLTGMFAPGKKRTLPLIDLYWRF